MKPPEFRHFGHFWHFAIDRTAKRCPLFSPDQDAFTGSSADIDNEKGTHARDLIDVELQPPKVEALGAHTEIHLPLAHGHHPQRQLEVDDASLVGFPGRGLTEVAQAAHAFGGVDFDERLLVLELNQRLFELFECAAAGHALGIDVL